MHPEEKPDSVQESDQDKELNEFLIKLGSGTLVPDDLTPIVNHFYDFLERVAANKLNLDPRKARDFGPDDVVQSLIRRIIDAPKILLGHPIQSKDHLKNYLAMQARRVCIDKLRRENNESHGGIERRGGSAFEKAGSGSTTHQIGEPVSDLEVLDARQEGLELQEMRQVFTDYLTSSLNDEIDRQLVKTWFENPMMTQKELAKKFNLAESTVSRRMLSFWKGWFKWKAKKNVD